MRADQSGSSEEEGCVGPVEVELADACQIDFIFHIAVDSVASVVEVVKGCVECDSVGQSEDVADERSAVGRTPSWRRHGAGPRSDDRATGTYRRTHHRRTVVTGAECRSGNRAVGVSRVMVESGAMVVVSGFGRAESVMVVSAGRFSVGGAVAVVVVVYGFGRTESVMVVSTGRFSVAGAVAVVVVSGCRF